MLLVGRDQMMGRDAGAPSVPVSEFTGFRFPPEVIFLAGRRAAGVRRFLGTQQCPAARVDVHRANPPNAPAASNYCGGMGLLGDLVKIVSDLVAGGRHQGEAPSREAGREGRRRSASTPKAPSPSSSSSSSSGAAARPHPARERARSSRANAEVSPGESGPDATREVDPGRIGPVRMSYAPQSDGAPDPGEIVWTWVPFEENDGRGKDRPVLVVAVESAGTYLAVQLTSKDHDGEGDFVPVGAGGWDGEHRPSWVNLDRVIRVHEGGMRRESTALPREPFERVTDRLHQRYGWR